MRASFLGGPETPAEEVFRDLTLRDERLAKAAAGSEDTVLWFEHDLYDQLQLLQVLDALADQRSTRIPSSSATPSLPTT